MVQDGSLAKGAGQAGYLSLGRGNVVGTVLPFPVAAESSDVPSDAASAFFLLRNTLAFSQRFAPGSCAGRSGQIAAWFALEAPDELASAPTLVGLWVARGVRVFAVAGAKDNALATSATGLSPGAISGLTRAGREVVRQILAAGALVDVSNASDPAIEDVIALASAAGAPVIASHSNARALADNPRNLSDAQIRQIAKSGGVIGVTAAHGLLAPGRVARLSHVVHQILYLVRVAGPDHVALGTGFEAGVSPVVDFVSAADFPRLGTALRAAGLSQKDVARVFHDNAARVLCARGSSVLRPAGP
jgi:membrane dipeptidase